MNHRLRLTFIFVVPMLLLLSISARVFSQSTGNPGGSFVSPDGYTVEGEFADYYYQANDPLILFGNPLSNVEDHPILPGVKVQYFLRARMELDPNLPEGQRVRLASLGVWLYDETHNFERVDWPFTPGACRIIGSRGIAVCYEFLNFYDAHEGEIYFGEPISTFIKLSNGRLVQYFERARMEWWPENPPEARVILTPVGKLDIDQARPGVLPTPKGNTERRITELMVNAFPARPFVASGSEQTINVIVRDQNSAAVSGALVKVALRMPDGQVINLRLPETNSKGLAQTKFVVGPYKPGQVIKIDVDVELQSLSPAETSTYFRVWW